MKIGNSIDFKFYGDKSTDFEKKIRNNLVITLRLSIEIELRKDLLKLVDLISPAIMFGKLDDI